MIAQKQKGDKEMEKLQYTIMNFDDPGREEIPISATTDNGARRTAKKTAKKYDISEYSIIFYRFSDGCRGWIDK